MAQSVGQAPPRQSPFMRLSLVFVLWKVLIGLLALLSPGIGYDTSSSLIFCHEAQPRLRPTPSHAESQLLNFVRWDAVYYTEMARHGHVFEQEWAFGIGLSSVLRLVAYLPVIRSMDESAKYATAGVLLSHVSHWFSVMLVYSIGCLLRPPRGSLSASVPYMAAVLHILSPAGIFLSAPYAESLFSVLNMLGFFLYLKSRRGTKDDAAATSLLLKLGSGISFGLAAAIRGNGVLNGIPFFIDAIEGVGQLFSRRVNNFEKSSLLLQLQYTIIAGCCIAAGVIYPQFIAYKEYCHADAQERLWCKKWLPSIYTFVQSHYWNVGFLKYWTLSNVPLFLLALPCLYLLIISGWQTCRPAISSGSTFAQQLQLRIALPQLILALLALTNYHVQIITRLSSGYPMWYFWTATKFADSKRFDVIVRGLVMYALVQAGLFASFLPPA